MMMMMTRMMMSQQMLQLSHGNRWDEPYCSYSSIC